MNIEEFRSYCLSKKGVTESFPFDETTLVFKVMGKMFALTNLDSVFRFTVKTNPDEGMRLREIYPCISPAWHMNKTHWITVTTDETLNDELLKTIINCSYQLVISGLTKKLKDELNRIR